MLPREEPVDFVDVSINVSALCVIDVPLNVSGYTQKQFSHRNIEKQVCLHKYDLHEYVNSALTNVFTLNVQKRDGSRHQFSRMMDAFFC